MDWETRLRHQHLQHTFYINARQPAQNVLAQRAGTPDPVLRRQVYRPALATYH